MVACHGCQCVHGFFHGIQPKQLSQTSLDVLCRLLRCSRRPGSCHVIPSAWRCAHVRERNSTSSFPSHLATPLSYLPRVSSHSARHRLHDFGSNGGLGSHFHDTKMLTLAFSCGAGLPTRTISCASFSTTYQSGLASRCLHSSTWQSATMCFTSVTS